MKYLFVSLCLFLNQGVKMPKKMFNLWNRSSESKKSNNRSFNKFFDLKMWNLNELSMTLRYRVIMHGPKSRHPYKIQRKKTWLKIIFFSVSGVFEHNIQIIIIRKYEDLAIEMKNIWKLNRVTTIPVVISVEAVVTPNFVRNLEKIDTPNWIFKQILQTCHIMRKFLN